MTQAATMVPAPSKWSMAEDALQLICAGKGNLNTLGQLIHGLVELGLGSLVGPVLGAVNIAGPEWQAQRAAILEQARQVSSGTLTWASRARIFSDNLAALTPENPSLGRLEEFWRQHQERYTILKASDGNYQVVDKQASVIFAGFVGGLIDHRALTRFWTYTCTGMQMPRPVAFDGAGYGWLLARVLESTNRTFLNYSSSVYVVEPDLVSACILLNLHDMRPWRDRLRLFVGSQAGREFEDGLRKNDHWGLPATLISERMRAPVDLQSSVTVIAEARKQRKQLLATKIDAHYASMTIDDWAGRYEAAMNGGKPLKVMGITSRFTTVLQYSMDELGEAIRAAGHEFVLCKESDDQSLDMPHLQLIEKHKPDLLVQISRMRYENPELPRNVPFLCWDQDNLTCMRTESAGKSLDGMTYVAGLGARWGYEQLDWPRMNCILAFQAAATHRYRNEPVGEALLRKHRCTFSYTSNASGSPESLAAQQRATYARDACALALFDRVANDVLERARTGYAWDTVQATKLLDSRIKSDAIAISAASRQEMIIHLRLLSDRAFRHVALGWVVEYCQKNKTTLRLYGNGWESNPRFVEHAVGFLAPGEELLAAYQATDINLQIIETGFLHSRALDGLAAGGFFLYRLAPEARDLDQTEKPRLVMTRRAIETGCVTYGQLEASTDPLIVGPWAYARTVIRLGRPDEYCRWLDIWEAAQSEEHQIPNLNEITFADQREFNAMADQFLANPDLRRDVAGRLRQVVVDRFSYDTRWRQFLLGITAGLRNASEEAAAPGTLAGTSEASASAALEKKAA